MIDIFTAHQISNDNIIHTKRVNKWLLLIAMILAAIYLPWWFVKSHIGNPVLYGLLLLGELYHVIIAFMFWMTIWPVKKKGSIGPIAPFAKYLDDQLPSVDVCITVAGEPTSVVRQTALAAKIMSYPNHHVYILNDGYVAKKPNWKEIETMAKEIGVSCITRKKPGGAKAGNINHGIKKTKGEIIVIFDADMVPYPTFLREVIPYFSDKRMGFVQTPQYYKNESVNEITRGAWQQQAFFFGPIMTGKDSYNSAFICGTNFAIRRNVLLSVGGMCEDNIAEDFLTSLSVHQKKWKSHYIPEVLTQGLAPEDLLSYYKQQHRWARGSLEVLFGSNPLFKHGLTWQQKIQYLFSALFYINGLIVLIDISMPIIFLLFGIQAVATTTTSFALFFLPFITVSLYVLYQTSRASLTFRAISFSQSSWVLQLSALKSVLFREKVSFSVTPKQAQTGNFLFLAYPHIGYLLVTMLAAGVGLYREGFNASIMTNIAWAVFNVILFIPFIMAAYPWKTLPQKFFFLRFLFPLSSVENSV